MPLLQPGDHVCLAKGHTGTIKHHAIVMTPESASDGTMDIMQFGVFDKDGKKKLYAGSGVALLGTEKSEVRLCQVSTKEEKWREVEYKKRDSSVLAPREVMRRASFLLENGANLLPKYNVEKANGEHVARWCKTGSFSSGQASKAYESANKVDKASKVLPMAAAVSGSKSKSSSSGKSVGSKTAMLKTAAVTVGAMAVEKMQKHHETVVKEWVLTNQRFDEAYASYAG